MPKHLPKIVVFYNLDEDEVVPRLLGCLEIIYRARLHDCWLEATQQQVFCRVASTGGDVAILIHQSPILSPFLRLKVFCCKCKCLPANILDWRYMEGFGEFYLVATWLSTIPLTLLTYSVLLSVVLHKLQSGEAYGWLFEVFLHFNCVNSLYL